MNRRRRSLLPVLALALLLAPAVPAPGQAPGQAQDPAPAQASATTQVPAQSQAQSQAQVQDRAQAPAPAPARAELLVEVSGPGGKPARSLAPKDLDVRVAGAPAAPTALGSGAPDRLAVYFDLPLLASKDVLATASALSDRGKMLTGVAPVEVVIADDRARTVLPANDDPEIVSQSLAGVGVRYGGRDELVEARRDYLEELAGMAGSPGSETERPGHLGRPSRRLDPGVEDRIDQVTREALAHEAQILRLDRQRLIAWVADQGAVDATSPAGAMLLVTGGWDEDPLVFYRAALKAYGLDALAERLPRPVILPSVAELGKVLAAYGWLTYPMLPGGEGAQLVPTPTTPAPSIRDTGPAPGSIPSGGHEVGRPALITPHFGHRKEKEKEQAEQAPGLPAPAGGREGLGALAAATGAELVTDPLQLGDLAQRLHQRLRLIVSTPEGDPQPVEVHLAAGVAHADRYTVRSRTWVSTSTPEAVASVRARQLLDDQLDAHGDLPVEAAFETAPSGVGDGRLTLRVGGVSGEPTPPAGDRLRATVGVEREDQEPLVFHRILSSDALPEAGLFRMPVTLPAGAETRIAVVVEDLTDHRWGTAVATYLEASSDSDSDAGADLDLLPSPQVVRLLAPREPFVMGRTEMQAVVSDARVRRVDFLLDGKRVAVRAEPPFRAYLDFGDLPRSRRVEAVAYGEGGDVLGRDTLEVNEGSGSFRVRITDPKPTAGSPSKPLTGPVEVVADVQAPADTPVARVDFYWNTSLVASRFAAPYRQRVVVPADSPQGFVRVVARLADGATTEDVVFLNEPGSGERLDVNLVEMYVVVTDRRGRPVSGLGPDDFRVYEEGQLQKIATFGDSQSLPLTVGLAIDSSASMFVKLPSVGLAASEFVRKSLRPKDRAFVVGFGGEPKLVQTTTSDDQALLDAIAGLKADGQTAIWASVVYSLVQLQGAPGKKAVIVYTDGADEDLDFSYRTALRFARRVGVPIYFILTNNEIVRTGGKGLGVRRFLGRVRRMTDEVGGKIYMVRADEDLSLVYRQIGQELRNQYLLAYYSKDVQIGRASCRERVSSPV